MRHFSMTLILAACISNPLSAQEKQFSGPQLGEELSAFKILTVKSPDEVEEVIASSDTEKDATFIVFLHKVNEPALGLMISLDWYAGKQKNLDSYYVLLAEDRAATETQLKRWAERSFFNHASLSLSLDGPEGPGRYGLNRTVNMTVLVAKDNKVVNNFALLAPNNTDAPKILEALAKALGQKEVPSIDKIREELRAERDRRRNRNLANNPIVKLAPNEELGRIMIRMIVGEGLNERRVAEVKAQLKKWAGDNKERQAALVKYSEKILDGNFRLNRYAREALEDLAGR